MATQEQLARAYAAANPKRLNKQNKYVSWNGWCASLMYRYNNATVSYSNALLAGNAVSLNMNVNDAPIGAVHYWAGVDGKGHVAQDVAGRGRKLFMASSRVTEMLGDAIGFVSFTDYQRAVNLPYRGWAMSYGVNPILPADDNGKFNDPTAPTPSGELRKVQGDKIEYMEPVGDLAIRIGNAMIKMGIMPSGFKNDGDPAKVWRTGVQNALIKRGYWKGTPDGLLGKNNLDGVQRLAKDRGGYTGPVDADPRINSWSGFAVALEK